MSYRVPRQFAPYIFGSIQSALTTGIATAIATYQSGGIALNFMSRWLSSWGVSWLVMLPLVVGFAPIIQRLVMMITRPPNIG